MSDEKVEINVTILGEKLRLILPGMGWTFDEAILAADATGGLGTIEIEQRILVGDPRAWLGVLHVSYMRANKDFPAEQIGGVDMGELSEAINAEVLAYIEKLPPTSPSENEPTAPSEPAESEPQPALDSA